MVLATTRFGSVEFNESDLINFKEGLLGFPEQHRFVLLDDPGDEVFAWLQCVDDPALAFPILEPELFVPQYKVQLARTDLEALGIKDLTQVRFYVVVTVPDDLTKMTANLKAPVVLHVPSRFARQCVLQDNGLSIREPFFAKLQERWVQKANAKPGTSGVSIKGLESLPGVVRISSENTPDRFP